MIRLGRYLIITVSLVIGGTSSAHAGILPTYPLDAVSGPGGATMVATTLARNSPSLPTARNSLVSGNFLTGTDAPLDLVLSAANSSGITQYDAFVSVTNFFDSPLEGLQFQLGIGTGVNFVAMSPGGLAYFVTPPGPTSSGFTNVSQSAGQITYTGGSLPYNTSVSFSFRLAVADATTPSFKFTLRETAITSSVVPEPKSLIMLTLGLSAILPWVHRPGRDERTGSSD